MPEKVLRFGKRELSNTSNLVLSVQRYFLFLLVFGGVFSSSWYLGYYKDELYYFGTPWASHISISTKRAKELLVNI